MVPIMFLLEDVLDSQHNIKSACDLWLICVHSLVAVGVEPSQRSSGFGSWLRSSPSCPSIWSCGCQTTWSLSSAWTTPAAVISTPAQPTRCPPPSCPSTCRWCWWSSSTAESSRRLRNSWRRSEGGSGTFITCITLHRWLPMTVLRWINSEQGRRWKNKQGSTDWTCRKQEVQTLRGRRSQQRAERGQKRGKENNRPRSVWSSVWRSTRLWKLWGSSWEPSRCVGFPSSSSTSSWTSSTWETSSCSSDSSTGWDTPTLPSTRSSTAAAPTSGTASRRYSVWGAKGGAGEGGEDGAGAGTEIITQSPQTGRMGTQTWGVSGGWTYRRGWGGRAVWRARFETAP